MVINRSAEVFELAPGGCRRATLPSILAASVAVNVAQRVASKEP
jgi:hypothetical protein